MILLSCQDFPSESHNAPYWNGRCFRSAGSLSRRSASGQVGLAAFLVENEAGAAINKATDADVCTSEGAAHLGSSFPPLNPVQRLTTCLLRARMSPPPPTHRHPSSRPTGGNLAGKRAFGFTPRPTPDEVARKTLVSRLFHMCYNASGLLA